MFFYSIIILTLVLISLVFVLKYLWVADSKTRTTFINISISLFTLFYIFIAMEGYFKFYFRQSDTWGHTFASKRWFGKYWNTRNSFGYRDIEHPEKEMAGKKILFMVGDSFVAGHGIEKCEDRFSDVLQKNLGKEWEVIIVAGNGWSTPQEYDAILSYPRKPDVIVLSYYINDILEAAKKHNLKPPTLDLPSSIIKPLVYKSYLVNFLYWRIYRITSSPKGFWEFLLESYSNKEIWQTHKNELLEIINYAKKEHVGLVSIVFPHLRKIKDSKVLTKEVVDLMKDSGVPVIDFGEKLKGRDVAGLVVNNFDSHPGVELNREIGNMLSSYVRKAYNEREGKSDGAGNSDRTFQGK